MADLNKAYEALEIQPTQDLQVVKSRYKKLALQYHPDKNSGGEEQFKIISEAYETICKHVKGQDEIDMEDPDFYILFELLHLFNSINTPVATEDDEHAGYASGGSSCEADDDEEYDDDEVTDADDAETDQEGSVEDDEEDLAGEIDESSDWAPEPETPAREIKHGHLDFHSHSHEDCHAKEDACSHLLSSFPGLAISSSVSSNLKPDHLELLKKQELQTKLNGGKTRVETDRERKTRVKLLLIEQETARQRREAEAKEKKEVARRAREHEKQEAAARRAEKNAKKRAQAQEKSAQARAAAKERLLATQRERSQLFDQLTACAKTLNDKEYYEAREAFQEALRKAEVAPTGRELLPGLVAQDITNGSSKQLAQCTLLHLAVQASDPELVAWLCKQGARPDERDSDGFTPFHRALQNGDKSMLDYFFETFPPFINSGQEHVENMRIYEAPIDKGIAGSLVMLATESGDAEVIDYVLDRSTLEEVEHCYKYAQKKLREARYDPDSFSAWRSVQLMLEQKEGFQIPLELADRPHGRPIHASKGGKRWYHKTADIRRPRPVTAQKAGHAKHAKPTVTSGRQSSMPTGG